MNQAKVNAEVTHSNLGLEKVLKEMIGGIDVGNVGNVYYVIQSTKAFYADFMSKYQQRYSDGSYAVHPDTGNGAGIQAAIDACKGGRSDYILVGTGAYSLTTALTLAGKSSVHLIGVNGQTSKTGTVGAALLQQTGNY